MARFPYKGVDFDVFQVQSGRVLVFSPFGGGLYIDVNPERAATEDETFVCSGMIVLPTTRLSHDGKRQVARTFTEALEHTCEQLFAMERQQELLHRGIDRERVREEVRQEIGRMERAFGKSPPATAARAQSVGHIRES